MGSREHGPKTSGVPNFFAELTGAAFTFHSIGSRGREGGEQPPHHPVGSRGRVGTRPTKSCGRAAWLAV